jgi:hypothetical protein
VGTLKPTDLQQADNLFFGCILFFSSLYAAEDTTLVRRELHLVSLLDDLRKAENDSEKNRTNRLLASYLYETIQLPGAYTYPFSNLKSIGFIDSPDGLIRIINWNVEQDDNTHRYFGYILRLDEKKKNVQVIELIDNSFMLPPQPTDVLDAENWYGALYYKIIPFEKGSKTMYTLLGWDGATSASNFKWRLTVLCGNCTIPHSSETDSSFCSSINSSRTRVASASNCSFLSSVGKAGALVLVRSDCSLASMYWSTTLFCAAGSDVK